MDRETVLMDIRRGNRTCKPVFSQPTRPVARRGIEARDGLTPAIGAVIFVAPFLPCRPKRPLGLTRGHFAPCACCLPAIGRPFVGLGQRALV